jgi:hypothetical protein
VINIRWPDVVSNELWDKTNPKPFETQIKERKWHWIGHTVRKPNLTTEKFVFEWNSQGTWEHSCLKKTWKQMNEEEALEMGETWRNVKKVGQQLS